jgi:hypothetical protein
MEVILSTDYPLCDFELRATNVRKLLPAELASVSFGLGLVRVRVGSSPKWTALQCFCIIWAWISSSLSWKQSKVDRSSMLSECYSTNDPHPQKRKLLLSLSGVPAEESPTHEQFLLHST